MDPELEALVCKQLREVYSLHPVGLDVLEYIYTAGRPVGIPNLVPALSKMPSRIIRSKATVNVRRGFSLEAPIVGRIAQGEKFVFIKKVMDWYQIFYDPMPMSFSYVSMNYVEIIPAEDELYRLKLLTPKIETVLKSMVSMELLSIDQSNAVDGGWAVCLTRKGDYLANVISSQPNKNQYQAYG